ncbi:MAG: hypothetical protein M3437_06740 [Chloroflexota bacterium]|nr:hypothetical protein [Chloroflexota bacterium]MDQ5867117.1 hypothetical protein [Chloroflexota bacterium]
MTAPTTLALSREQAEESVGQTPTDRAGAFLRSGWFAALFFLAATVAYTWPLVTHMATTMPDALDSTDTARQLAEIARNLSTNPLRIYDSQGLYPLDNDLALNELLVAQGIYAAPIIWLTGNMLLAWNLVTFSSYMLSGLAAWLLVRKVTGSSLAGLAAGIIYTFSPWHYGQYGHLGIQAIQWMVFGLYFLVLFMEHTASSARLLDRRGLFYLGLFAFFAVLQALSAGYYAYFEAILFGAYLLYYALRHAGLGGWLGSKLRRVPSPRVDWRRLAGQMALLGLAGVVALAAIYPFVRPYNHYKNLFGFNRSLEEVEYWSAGPLSLLRTTTTSLWYEPVQKGIFGLETSAEREMYPGVFAVTLALIGLFAMSGAVRQGLGRGFFAAIVVIGFVLSLGPTFHWDSYGLGDTGVSLPWYRWLYEYVPGFDAVRVPHRFVLLAMLGIGALAGFGIVRLMRWSRDKAFLSPGIVGGVALFLVMLDFFAPGLRYITRGLGEDAPPIYRWLAGPEAEKIIPGDALLLELPVGLDKTPVNTSPQYLLYGVAHGRPMLNGSPNIIPPGYERLFSEMRRFPTPGTLDIIEGLGVQYLIVHTGGLLNDEKRAELERIAAEGVRLEPVVSLPDVDPYGQPAPNSKVVVYRVKTDATRFDWLKSAIPPGSSVLLADHPSKLRLTNTALPNLLGHDRRYFTTYHTIYDPIVGPLQDAQPGERYDFAIIYNEDDPTNYGYTPEDRVDIGDIDLIQAYRKR